MSSSSRIDGPGRKELPKQQPWSNGDQVGVQSVWQVADYLLDQNAGSGKFSDAGLLSCPSVAVSTARGEGGSQNNNLGAMDIKLGYSQSVWQAADYLLDQIAGSGKFSDAELLFPLS